MLDGELGGDVVNLAEVQPVTVTTVELILHGTDLVDDPDCAVAWCRCGTPRPTPPGSTSTALHPLGDGECDAPGGWCLAELHAGGERYVLRAVQLRPTSPTWCASAPSRPW